LPAWQYAISLGKRRKAISDTFSKVDPEDLLRMESSNVWIHCGWRQGCL